jgi:hypothetical protein
MSQVSRVTGTRLPRHVLSMPSYDIPCGQCDSIRHVMINEVNEDACNIVADRERRDGMCMDCAITQPSLSQRLAAFEAMFK